MSKPLVSPRRHRLFQFSLRALMIVSVVVAMLAGWIGRGFYLAQQERANYIRLQLQQDVTQEILQKVQSQILARPEAETFSHVASTSSSSSPREWRIVSYRSQRSEDNPYTWRLEVGGSVDSAQRSTIVITDHGGAFNTDVIDALEKEYQLRDWAYEIRRARPD